MTREEQMAKVAFDMMQKPPKGHLKKEAVLPLAAAGVALRVAAPWLARTAGRGVMQLGKAVMPKSMADLGGQVLFGKAIDTGIGAASRLSSGAAKTVVNQGLRPPKGF